MPPLSSGMRAIVPQLGMELGPPAIESQNLSNWTSREIPLAYFPWRNVYSSPLCGFVFCFFFFLTILHSLHDLSSPTRDQTVSLAVEVWSLKPLDYQGSPLYLVVGNLYIA